MLTLTSKIRKIQGKKVKALRQKGILPAVLYGPKMKTENLEVDLKEFEKTLQEAGESTLISLLVEGKKDKYVVLIHEVEHDPLTGALTHVDFYQPSLTQEIEIKVPIILVGEAPAVKNLGGTLIKNISEVAVKALPEKLPKEIEVNVAGLNSFEDNILVKDIKMSEGVRILREPGEVIAHVAPPEKVEEELGKPIEEKIEEIEKVDEKKKEEAGSEGSEPPAKGEARSKERRPEKSGREEKKSSSKGKTNE
ncbi:MAG: 50S ribosomal protein L25 [Candidatus Nealsonbacteria bacterium]|nr:50S ribosomal protein L25 [Candidatus Nealsonbacteria bacterium]